MDQGILQEALAMCHAISRLIYVNACRWDAEFHIKWVSLRCWALEACCSCRFSTSISQTTQDLTGFQENSASKMQPAAVSPSGASSSCSATSPHPVKASSMVHVFAKEYMKLQKPFSWLAKHWACCAFIGFRSHQSAKSRYQTGLCHTSDQ